MANKKNKKKLSNKIKKWIIACILAILIFACCFFAGIYYASKEEEADITATALYERLVEIEELSVIEYQYAKVGRFENSLTLNGWNIPLTEKYFILTYTGVIKAGVDLSDALVEVDGNTVTITLPATEILSNELDEESIEVYDESNNIFNQIAVSDYTTFALQQKEVVEAEAIEDGILEEAEDRVTMVLTSIINAIDESYTVEVIFLEEE